MKQAALATAILTTLVTIPSVAATIYNEDGTRLKLSGRAEARFNLSDENKSESTDSFKDKSRARLKITGKTKISDDLYGFGKYESEFDYKEDLTNRYYHAGLGTAAGEFSYGKQDTAQVMLTDITDTMATFGAEAADIVSGNKDKRENTFLYAGEFDALMVQASFTAADEDNTTDTESFGIAALYNFGMFELGAGYVDQSYGDEDGDQFNLVAQVAFDNITLGGLYTMGSKKDDDYTGYEFSAKFKPRVRPNRKG